MAYGLTDKFNFGKHKGETIQEVIEDEITYLEWCMDAVDGFDLDEQAYQVYNDALDSYYWSEESKYPSPHYSDW